jgi:membrane-bound lytic murein transglycosylase B
MLKFLLVFLLPLLLLANDDRPPVSYDYLKLPQVRHFIDQMVKKHKFDRKYITETLRYAKLDRDTLDRYTGRYKVNSTNGSWERYKAHVLDPETLDKAIRFKKKYYKTLERASKEYDVDMNYIVGFIAVESKFGHYTGDYNVLHALATLAFHKNRMQRFFRSELEELFLMSREQGYDIRKLEGSFAGAMGVVQQMPSVFRRYGMDYNHDGVKDPWSIEDGIGIIARFMHKNKWKNGMCAAVTTNWKGGRYNKPLRPSKKKRYRLNTLKKYGIKPTQRFPQPHAYLLRTRNKTHDDLYLGTSNFSVIRRYNNATTYCLAIHLIADHVK